MTYSSRIYANNISWFAILLLAKICAEYPSADDVLSNVSRYCELLVGLNMATKGCRKARTIKKHKFKAAICKLNEAAISPKNCIISSRHNTCETRSRHRQAIYWNFSEMSYSHASNVRNFGRWNRVPVVKYPSRGCGLPATIGVCQPPTSIKMTMNAVIVNIQVTTINTWWILNV